MNPYRRLPFLPFKQKRKRKNDPIKITCSINFMFGFAEGKRKERKGRYFYCLVSRVGRKCERIEEKVSLGTIKPCLPKLGGRARKTEQGIG